MEYLHFLWKEQNASSTIPRNGLPLSSFLAMTGSLVARMVYIVVDRIYLFTIIT